MTPREHVALAPHCTLGVGGPARWFVDAADEGAVLEAVAWARDRGAGFRILGGGSNVVVADAARHHLVNLDTLEVIGREGTAEGEFREPHGIAVWEWIYVVDSGNGHGKSSGVRRIDDDDRVAELARMLAGLGESDSGRAHARELLEAAQQERTSS